ncbi:hypothetical protein AKJ16_DCAP01262 [Drosera capensis]
MRETQNGDEGFEEETGRDLESRAGDIAEALSLLVEEVGHPCCPATHLPRSVDASTTTGHATSRPRVHLFCG